MLTSLRAYKGKLMMKFKKKLDDCGIVPNEKIKLRKSFLK